MAGHKHADVDVGGNHGKVAIAVIGIGCRYPGAESPAQLWENILARRQQFRPIPDVRLPMADYGHADPRKPDATYARLAAVIDGYAFDWAGRRIPKVTAEATDLAHWLALDTALQMLDDAGYDAGRLPGETTQVIVGNTLTGEFTRANTLRGRWPFVRKALRLATSNSDLPPDTLALLEARMEAAFKSPFAEVNEDTLAGGLANTIAGRISNYLNVNGGCHIVDGACSASLIAIHSGAASLAAGQADFVIAGGVDISLDPFELIGFAKTGALTPGAMRVYDARGDGFIPGEGCGFVGLKRLDDALADGDKVYAVLDGWGMSSDGRGGITAPSVNGQHLSLARAYRGAGIDAGTLDFIEGHGTGTRLGDKTELLAIARTLDQGHGPARHCGVTSFKSIVGHTKAAAGIGAFIKGVMAVNQRVLPPTAGCEQPHPVFGAEGRALYPLRRGEVRPAESRLRAGVSAMGFGGINVHVTLASPPAPPQPHLCGVLDDRARMATAQSSELFLFAGRDADELAARVATLRGDAVGMAQAELTDLAAHCAGQCSPALRCRAAIVASTPDELLTRLDALADALRQPWPTQPRLELARGYAYGQRAAAPRIGFLFPGQGSQQLGMTRPLLERHEWARELVAQVEGWTSEAGLPGLGKAIWPLLDRAPSPAEREPLLQALRQTETAQPAIVLSSLLWLRWLAELGVHPSAVLGHSLGELTAFHAAGAFGTRELIELTTMRGRRMADGDGPAGGMASLACSREQAASLLERCAVHGYAVLANLNSDTQHVVSGEATAVDAVIALAQGEGVRTYRLPVGHAFHSQLVADAAQYMRERAPIPNRPVALQATLLSSCTEGAIATDCDLHRHFGEQIVRPVEFAAAAAALASHCDLLLEVGPGRVLSQLLPHIAAAGGIDCLPLEGDAEDHGDLNRALAAAHVHGADLDCEALHADRVVRPFVPAARRRFIVNPCERPLRIPDELAARTWPVAPPQVSAPITGTDLAGDAVAQLRDYLSRRGDFLADVIRADLRSLPGTSMQALISPPATPPTRSITHEPEPTPAPTPVLTSAPPEVPPSVGTAAIVMDMIAQATGYAPDTLSPSMRMGDDLNLDSIKAGEVVGRIAQHFALADRIDPSDFAQRPLTELVAQIDTLRLPRVATIPETAAGHREEAWDVLRQLVAQSTGFSEDSVQPHMRLTDDLNLDSIKAGALIGEAAQRLGIAGQVDAGELSGAELGTIAGQLQQLRPGLIPTVVPAALATPDAQNLLVATLSRLTGFAPAQITPELRLIDDLNLDSIKQVSALADVIAQLGLAGKLDPGERVGDSVAEIARWLQSAVTASFAQGSVPQAAAPDADADAPGWACAYRMTLEAEHSAHALPNVLGLRIRLQADGADEGLAEALAAYLAAAGAQLVQDDAVLADVAVDHYLALLPRHGTWPREACAEDVPALVATLHRAVHEADRLRCRSLAFVQFGLGQDVRGETAALVLGNACAQAFAASLHLERPNWAVRVLDFDTATSNTDIAASVHVVLDGIAGYRARHVDAQGQPWRFTPRVLETAALPSRVLDWNGDDLVLVTGGGKGITAELAFAFAQRCGVRLALVGSTPLQPGAPASAEIEATLARFVDAGLAARYYACDLGDRNALAQLVETIQRHDGQITGILHGAGSNRPRRVEQVSASQALEEIEPKLCGLLNLCELLKAHPPKMIVALGSIIGVTGMPGNAWYAFSNQALDHALAQFHRHHPGTAVLTLAYSVWSEIGMGARLGTVHRLAEQGVSGIATAAGVDRFLELLQGHAPTRQVIVAGRLHGLDTWQPNRDALRQPARFLEQVTVFEPGVELIARAHLRLDRDLYLRDHYYRGVHLFPTVLGLEAMTQAALAVTGADGGDSYRIESVRLEHPIVIDSGVGTEIELRAWVRPRMQADAPWHVEVGIRTAQSGFRRDHFSAVVVLAPLAAVKDTTLPRPQAPLDQFDPTIDLYGGLLFQGPLFQRLTTVFDLDRDGAQTRIRRHRDGRYFGEGVPAALSTGDPAFRDSLLQAAQLSEQGQYLPIGIDRIDIHDRLASRQGAFHVSSRVLERTGDTLVCEVTAYDDDGCILEHLQGYHLKRVHLDPQAPLPEDWRDPGPRDSRLLEGALRRACAAFGLRPPAWAFLFAPGLSRMNREQRRRGELPLFAQAIEGALPAAARADGETPQVQWDAQGKPGLADPHGRHWQLSLSHDASHCLATCGPAPQGCDIEPIAARDEEAWRMLLGESRMPLLRQLVAAGDSRDVAGTRLWCALETARKALGAGGIELRLQDHADNAATWTASVDGRTTTVLTFAMTPTRPRPKMFAFTVAGPRAAAAADAPASAGLHTALIAAPPAILPAATSRDDSVLAYSGRGEQGQNYWAHRFRVPFKDITSHRRGLSLPTLADWMGELRELGIAAVGRQLVPDFASGGWGMVTNHSEIVVVGDVACLDQVEGRLWSSRVYGRLDSSVDMHFDWVRIAEDGSEQRIAYCEMATTWVAIKGHGVVEVAAYPKYLRDLIASMLPTEPLPRAPMQLRRPLPEPLAQLGFAGAPLYSAPAAPRVEPVLERRVFATSLEESNLVGNIYFANYYHWQGRLIDHCLYALAPEIFQEHGSGSLQCIRSTVQHLREAMPFDDIEVSMALKQLYQNGLRLHFEYHHRSRDGRLTKLAVGEADCLWLASSQTPVTAALPAPIRNGLLVRCGARGTAGHAALGKPEDSP